MVFTGGIGGSGSTNGGAGGDGGSAVGGNAGPGKSMKMIYDGCFRSRGFLMGSAITEFGLFTGGVGGTGSVSGGAGGNGGSAIGGTGAVGKCTKLIQEDGRGVS